MSRTYWQTWVATLLFFGAFYALLVPLPRYLTAIGLPDWQIGLILGAFGIASLVGRPLVGVATDRCGWRPVVLAGAALFVVGALGVTLTTVLPLLFALRVMQATGYVAFTTAATALVAAQAPAAQRGRALAIFGVAANVAMTLTPAAMDAALPLLTLVGAFWLAAGMGLGAAVLAWRLPPSLPTERSFRWRALLVVPPPLRVPMAASSLLGVGFGAFLQFMPLLVERRGGAPAGLIYTAYGVGIIGTRVLTNRWLDTGNIRHVLSGGFGALGAGLLLLAYGSGVVLFVAGALLVAASGGILHPALMAHHVALLPGERGRAVAIFYLGMDLGIGMGGWLLGFVLQYTGLTGLYLAAAIAGTCGLLLIRPIDRQERALVAAP